MFNTIVSIQLNKKWNTVLKYWFTSNKNTTFSVHLKRNMSIIDKLSIIGQSYTNFNFMNPIWGECWEPCEWEDHDPQQFQSFLIYPIGKTIINNPNLISQILLSFNEFRYLMTELLLRYCILYYSHQIWYLVTQIV